MSIFRHEFNYPKILNFQPIHKIRIKSLYWLTYRLFKQWKTRKKSSNFKRMQDIKGFAPRKKIQPLKYAFKISPPTITLFYKRSSGIEKLRKYEIFLNDLIMLPDSEAITRRLFMEHALYLDHNVLKFKQVYICLFEKNTKSGIKI